MAISELDIEALERKLNYRFVKKQYLQQALTHRSKAKKNNERFEFLGDSLLGFVISQLLFKKFPKQDEGMLTRMRSTLVKKQSLASIANDLTLSRYLQLSAGEAKAGGCFRDSTLADAFEAIIAAIYFDAGFAQAEKFVTHIYEDKITQLDPDKSLKDPKSRLQELLQQNAQELPTYELIQTTGPAHAQIFTVRCYVELFDKTYTAKASSRRDAEQKSASDMLAFAQKYYEKKRHEKK